MRCEIKGACFFRNDKSKECAILKETEFPERDGECPFRKKKPDEMPEMLKKKHRKS